MRLSGLASAYGLRQRAVLGFIRTVQGWVPEIVRMMAYRPEYFGRRYFRAVRDGMRGSSSWSVADRELMAAYTSRQNECQYCVGAHSTAAHFASGHPAMVNAALEDPTTAPISERLQVVLPFLRKLTLTPSEVIAEDLKPLRDAGLGDEDILDATYVCVLFCIMNRMADALDFALEDENQRRDHAKFLVRLNYRSLL